MQNELTYLTKPLPSNLNRIDEKSSPTQQDTDNERMFEENIDKSEQIIPNDQNKSVVNYLTKAFKIFTSYDLKRPEKMSQNDHNFYNSIGINIKNFKPVHKRSMSEEGIANLDKKRSDDQVNQKELFSNLFEEKAEGKLSPAQPVANAAIVADQTVEALKSIKTKSNNEPTKRQRKNSTGSEDKLPVQEINSQSQPVKKIKDKREYKRKTEPTEKKKLAVKHQTDEMSEKPDLFQKKSRQIADKKPVKSFSPDKSAISAISGKLPELQENKKSKQINNKTGEKSISPMKASEKDIDNKSSEFPNIKPTFDETANCRNNFNDSYFATSKDIKPHFGSRSKTRNK